MAKRVSYAPKRWPKTVYCLDGACEGRIFKNVPAGLLFIPETWHMGGGVFIKVEYDWYWPACYPTANVWYARARNPALKYVIQPNA